MAIAAPKPKNTTGWVYIRKNKTKPNEAGRWHDKKKVEAVTTYLATGNLALTSRIVNIPEITLRKWVVEDWWKDLIAETQHEGDLKLNKNMEKIVEKSLAAVNEIIDNGDYLYDAKKGKIVRVPAKLRDVNKIATDLIDRQMIMRKQQKPVADTKENTEGRLLKLAEQFAMMVAGKKTEENVIKDVVEGEWENVSEESNASGAISDDPVQQESSC